MERLKFSIQLSIHSLPREWKSETASSARKEKELINLLILFAPFWNRLIHMPLDYDCLHISWTQKLTTSINSLSMRNSSYV